MLPNDMPEWAKSIIQSQDETKVQLEFLMTPLLELNTVKSMEIYPLANAVGADSPPPVTRRNREVIYFTRYHVKNNTELTNLMKMNRIQGYNGKYGSNQQGIKEFLDVIFKFDQIGQEIDGRNWGKMVF